MSGPAIRQAVILAAGLGTRLMPLTADRPKALVEVAGTALLRRMLDSCERAGLSRALVVTGHRRQQLVDWLERYDGALHIDTVHNDAYDTLGNAWSVYAARNHVDAHGFVKLDGDLLLDDAIMRRLLGSEHASAIMVDRSAALDEEAMKAQLDGAGLVAQMGKWLSVGAAAGESIGVEKIGGGDAQMLFDAIEQMVEQRDRPNAYYEDVYHALVAQGWQLGACSTEQDWWCEVDNNADLARAVAHIEAVP